jgi:hypothetical protein
VGEKLEIQKKYERRIVAFVDILGFRKKIKETEGSDDGFNHIENLVKGFNLIEKAIRENFSQEIISGIQVSTFSDSIILSFPVEIEDALFHTVNTLSWLQMNLLFQNQILLRGALTIGDILHTNKIAFGPAFIKAYDLEKDAKTPRIIIDPEIIQEHKKWLEKTSTQDLEKSLSILGEQKYVLGNLGKNDMSLTSDDGDFRYIDYIKNAKADVDDPHQYKKFLKIVSNFVQDQLALDLPNDVKEKYDWLKSKITNL